MGTCQLRNAIGTERAQGGSNPPVSTTSILTDKAERRLTARTDEHTWGSGGIRRNVGGEFGIVRVGEVPNQQCMGKNMQTAETPV
jgi:hypothetical protein